MPVNIRRYVNDNKGYDHRSIIHVPQRLPNRMPFSSRCDAGLFVEVALVPGAPNLREPDIKVVPPCLRGGAALSRVCVRLGHPKKSRPLDIRSARPSRADAPRRALE
jgi:hypothetical protein